MALSAIEILGTIPLATYFIVSSAKAGVIPWTSWADVHAHYSEIDQIPSFIWKYDPQMANSLEIFRWSLVACAFIFFAFFGLADEARQRYHDVYTSLAGRIVRPRSILHGSSRVCVVPSLCWSTWTDWGSFFKQSISSVPHVVTAGGDKLRSSPLLNDQPSISIASDLEHDLKMEHNLPSDTVASSSMESIDEPRMRGQLTLPAGIVLTVSPASVPPHFPDTTKSIMRAYSGVGVV
jgi:pheromone a factor receptor